MTLRESLVYEPAPLKFGTSGRRGLVRDLTQLEVYINALAEIRYLQSLPTDAGGILAGQEFYFAADLRPSSTKFDTQAEGRGEIAQAIEQAIRDAGMRPVFLGAVPTPALAWRGFSKGLGSVMVTGSHIPFDRNGYKTNRSNGELLKSDEEPINRMVDRVRAEVYQTPAATSVFSERGMLKRGHRELPAADPTAEESYIARYLSFFPPQALMGMRVLVYEHSAVGRDLLARTLTELGAEVVRGGRSEEFVPIDTENIDEEQLAVVQRLANEACQESGPIQAVVSTDGDSDRPLVLGVNRAGKGSECQVRFYGGDLLGMLVAEYLGADAVVVPISCNDAIDRGPLKDRLEPKTRIGSPYVVEGMNAALAKGKQVICGWEANGGFLTGSVISKAGRALGALPTRDALLPILAVLCAARERGLGLEELFAGLPQRYSKAALIKNFPRAKSLEIVAHFSPENAAVKNVHFGPQGVQATDGAGKAVPLSAAEQSRLAGMPKPLQEVFSREAGFTQLTRANYTDGLRLYFSNGDVAHVRPSGNADELRIYAVADTRERAEAIAQHGVEEPDGLLRKLARLV